MKRHKAHEHTGHGSRPGSHSGGHKAKHHDGIKSAHGGRKTKKRSNKENAKVTRPLMENVEKRLKDVAL